MQPAPIPDHDEQRLASLAALHLLGTPAEIEFDRVVRTAAAHFQVPIALVSLIDSDEQWFKARFGLDIDRTGRDISFCGHAILEEDALVVLDASQDLRFADNPLVIGGPQIAFYAGQPIHAPDGAAIGTLCLIDKCPRDFDDESRARLRDFGRWLQLVIENRELGETLVKLLADIDQARRDSMICPLTQCWNRRGFTELLSLEMVKAKRDATPLAIGTIDVDHFKRINDTYGHAEGDAALVLLSRILRETIRGGDIVARVGGEEFIVVMPGVNQDHALRLAEKLRRAVERQSCLPGGDRFTISLGLCWLEPHSSPLDEAGIIEISDQALYEAKRSGRNRVIIRGP